MRLQSTGDAYTQMQPRHTSRKERHPGVRERHAAQRERHSPDTPRKRIPNSPRTTQSSTYCHTSGVEYNQPIKTEIQETEIKTSLYKELSTIEDIRASMRATACKTTPRAVSHVPNWLLNLDINLDVTSSDIIPPFENTHSIIDNNDTFNETATMSHIYDSEDDYEVDSTDDLNNYDKRSMFKEDDKRYHKDMFNDEIKQLNTDTNGHTSGQIGLKTVTLVQTTSSASRPVSPTIRMSRSSGSARSRQTLTRSGTWDDKDYGPRRFQGDKKVMSMQQGGIRSTPMQPKSKKYINQMLTLRHMKIHDNKLQKAKPAVDTKMPSTFKIALDRKRLVETRLSQSWESSRDSNDYRSSRSSLSQSITKKSNR